MKQYRIGEYAKYLGVTPDFLKYYEQMGIIRSERSESGYRFYSFHTTLDLIESVRLRNYGLTLRQIRDVLNGQSTGNAEMEALFEQNLDRLQQEILLDEALTEDYRNFLEWKEPLEDSSEYWEIRRSRPMLFLPHTDDYDFLHDERIYELLNTWMSYIPIVKSSMKAEPDGNVTWGFLADEGMSGRLRLPINSVVEHIPAQRVFYYKFRTGLLRMSEEHADNPEHPAFRTLRSLGLEPEGSYFRTALMPADWTQRRNVKYGYYAIPLRAGAPR